MTLLGHEFTIDGQQLDPDVTERIQSASLIGSMDTDEGAGRIELKIWDGDGQLMRKGKLATSRRPRKTPFPDASWARFGEARLALDGILFRLAAINVAGQYATLTWDDEAAALMRRHTRAIVTSRGTKTRAQTIGLAVDAVKEIAVPYRSPEERIKQNVDAPDDDSESKGLSTSDHLTVKTARANREQLRNMEIALTVADQLLAGERATLAALVAGIAESRFQTRPEPNPEDGVLQVISSTRAGITPRTVIDPRTGSAHGAVTRDVTGRIAPGTLDPHDVKEVFRVFFLKGFAGVGAIKYAADHPDDEIYEIAQAVQASGAGRPSNGEKNYGPWVDEAERILAAWGGVGQTQTVRERFQYRIGGKLSPDDEKPENYWAGSGRLADDIEGWQRWAWRNQVSYISDEWLFRRKPVIVLGPGSVYPAERPADSLAPFVDLSYYEDVGSAIAEVTITGPARRWDGAPGSTVLLDDLGPISGKWLLRKNDFDLQRDIATIVLRRPVAKQPEPAPTTRTISTGPADAPGDLAYPLAEKGDLIGTPGTGTHAWGQNWQSANAIDIGVPIGTTVYAVEDGIISPPGTQFSGFGDGGSGRFAGKRLHLKASGSSRCWFYTHLSAYEPGIDRGARVTKGQVLGKSGSANGVAHLHIAVGPNLKFNPKKLLGFGS